MVRKMRNTAITLFVLLFLTLIGNYLQWRSADLAQRDRNLEAKEFVEKSRKIIGHIHHRDSIIQLLFNDRHQDSLMHAENQGVLKSKISALKSKVATSSNRLPVIQDTIIVFQDSLIADLEAERDTLYIRDNAMVDSLQKSNFELKELFTGQLKESIRLTNELQREKKRRFSVGPHAGYGFKGPDLGVSIQYTLFRF